MSHPRDTTARELLSGDAAPNDPWIHRSERMHCQTCMYYVPKGDEPTKIGRCRRHAPTMTGYPVVFGPTDWCGDHKLDEAAVATS